MSDKSFHMEIESETKHLAPVRTALKTFLDETGLSTKDKESIQVAMGEAVTNCIRHSYNNEPGHKIEISASYDENQVTFRLRDYGKKFDRSKLKKPELPPTKGGGLGVYFMETIMDEMRYNTELEQGNELVMVKYKKGDQPS